MITEKKESLKAILESSDGIHMTAYLKNSRDLAEIKSQLNDIVKQTDDCLIEVLTEQERKNFVKPLINLIEDSRILKNIKGNIGLFRTKDKFRILNIPVDVDLECHVANSFHIKPLLRWMQVDRDFLILCINSESVHLYTGSQNYFHKVDYILFDEILSDQKEIYLWINDWLNQTVSNFKSKLFLVGEDKYIKNLTTYLSYKNVVRAPVCNFFEEQSMYDVCFKIRKTLKDEAKKQIEHSLMEFRFADELNMTKKNIFQIAKAAVKGRVRKLIVASEIKIFGRLDKNTGGLAIHPFDLDHEDDDILDDLAQTVLASGGEVVVASKDDIPKGRPALAIVEDPDNSKEIQKEIKQFRNAIERSPV